MMHDMHCYQMIFDWQNRTHYYDILLKCFLINLFIFIESKYMESLIFLAQGWAVACWLIAASMTWANKNCPSISPCWRHVTSKHWVNIISKDGMLPDVRHQANTCTDLDVITLVLPNPITEYIWIARFYCILPHIQGPTNQIHRQRSINHQ